MIITISQYRYKKAREFAVARMNGSKNLYAYRGESNQDKMLEDIIIGVLGEWGAYEYLKSIGILSSKPDLNIYGAKKKSFNADLRCIDNAYHVKSQSKLSAKTYGHSWLLQNTDRIVKNPASNDYFILTCVDGLNVDILAVLKCATVKFGECKVPRYRHSKVALYLKDINIDDFKLGVLDESSSM